MKKFKGSISFSPVIRGSEGIMLYKNISIITLNGGGGMGGSREIIRGEIINWKTVDLGFILIKEVITGEFIDLNPLYVGSIRKRNVTEFTFLHNNSNFPSGKQTHWFTHHINTEIELFVDDRSYPSIEGLWNNSELRLELIMTNNYL